ncbi:AsmA family protein [Aureimonas pseudogalii]|uniref:Uncharacterized protein involved in outer membrane biogenesis n=1 Tax=Aureimonas pseudogalii TaxID=1744844 RepID=A0A7W6H4V5_9HYPH|nr:AsmA-like C-terminal region-containing protein [Aureimonas pseudogalii]MBB3998479.1 uncharacterized protein involved in outer membrane biogenesis [Aureimonas pseudogalii]
MKVFIVLGSLLVAALLVLLVGPRFVDWTAYRASFETEASRILGQRVVVNGAASVRILPFPSVTFADVAIGDDPAAPVLTVRRFSMDAELAPYLSGEIRIFDMRIESPKLDLSVGADGQIRWPIGASASGPSTPVVVERLEIGNGAVTLRDARTGRTLALTDVDTTIAARSLRGPFTGEGTLFAAGEPLRFTVSTGADNGDGSMPLRVTAQSDRAGLAVSIDGLAAADGERPLLDGRLLVSTLPPKEGETPGPEGTAPPPFQLEGGLRITPSTIDARELKASIGGGTAPYLATGEASLDLGAVPHFDLRLEGQEFDVDAVVTPSNEGAAPSMASRVEGLRAALARIPTVSIPGRVAVSLPLVTLGDTAIRNLRFAGSPTGDGWSIETLSSEWPGRTLLEASGVATLRGEPRFRGSMLLAVRQPAAFVRWAGGGADPAIARLDRAGFSAEVDLAEDAQAFRDLELDLGGQMLSGSIVRSLRPEDRVVTVDLHGGRVELDAFAALFGAFAAGGPGIAPGERLDMQFEANPLRYADTEVGHVSADFTLDDGLLDIASFDAAGFAGADLHLEGTVADLFLQPAPDLSVDVSAAEPGRFIAFLQERLPNSPLLASLRRTAATLGPLQMQGTAASQPGAGAPALRVDLDGTAAGTKVGLAVAVENGLAARDLDGRFGLELSLANDTPAVLLDQLGLPALGVATPAPLTLVLKASGTPNAATAHSLRLTAPGSTIGADGTMTIGADGLATFATRLSARSRDLAPWLTALAVAAGQGLDALPVDLNARLAWDRGGWTLSDASGTVAGTRVNADLRATPGASVAGEVVLSELSGEWLWRLLTGLDDGDPDAASTPFGASLLPARPFALALSADRVTGLSEELTGLRTRLISDGGALSADGLEATLAGARLTGSGAFRNVAGTASLQAKARLANFPLGDDPAADLLTGRLTIEGTLAGGGRSMPELLASLAGDGAIELQDASLRGVRPDLLAAILPAADADGFTPTAESVEALVAAASPAARFDLGTATLPFAVAAGTLRVPSIDLRDGPATLAGEVRLAMAQAALDGSLVLSLPPSDDAAGAAADATTPSLAYRVGGTLRDPSLTADAQPLVGYLAARAYEREQARVEALQEDLRESVRLRREARLYRERQSLRDALRDAREAAEVEAERQAAAAAAAETERQAAAVRDREAAAAAEAAAQEIMRRTLSNGVVPPPSGRETSPSPAQGGAPGPRLDFRADSPAVPAVPSPSRGFPDLPGVGDPNAF